MASAFGIVNSSGNHIWVEGLQDHRPIGAFSFLGRYRVIDFPISNLSNSGIDRIQVYVRRKPRSITEHIGTGRHYNINSKRGRIQILFSEDQSENSIYNTDIAAFMENIESIEKMHEEYVVITPNYLIFTQDFSKLLDAHIESGADITLLYHSVDNAKDAFLNSDILNLNKQKGVLSIEKNRGTAKSRNIFLDTYVMKKDLFLQLIKNARNLSSMYTLAQIVNSACDELDIRGVAHRGYFAAITSLQNYYEANMSLIDYKNATALFNEEWPIYTRTNDSAPTQYIEGASVKHSVVSNGCIIEGTVENSIIGRACTIEKGAVVKNSVILPDTKIGKNSHIENFVVDKHTRIVHENQVIGNPEKAGYVTRGDRL
ncbi:MAG: glucose-1-phosphate adenylyltransferase subunit GlgD [Lachnospiraceae bacterium]|nr:glucose-1-phosphate adenylyltransferase subunit GlgD [Lachnospiraceae bacterium]